MIHKYLEYKITKKQTSRLKNVWKLTYKSIENNKFLIKY